MQASIFLARDFSVVIHSKKYPIVMSADGIGAGVLGAVLCAPGYLH